MLGDVPPFTRLTSLPAIHATIVKGALEAEGITVVLDGGSTGPYVLDTGTWATSVMVPADQVQRAEAVLAAFDAPDADGEG